MMAHGMNFLQLGVRNQAYVSSGTVQHKPLQHCPLTRRHKLTLRVATSISHFNRIILCIETFSLDKHSVLDQIDIFTDMICMKL